MEKVFSAYLNFYELCDIHNIQQLEELLEPDVHFKDPFNDFVGADRLIELFKGSLYLARNPAFKIIKTIEQGDSLLAEWDFSFSNRLMAGGPRHIIRGVTLLKIGEQGKISEHIDYWDSGLVYSKIPVVRFIFSGVRRVLIKLMH